MTKSLAFIALLVCAILANEVSSAASGRKDSGGKGGSGGSGGKGGRGSTATDSDDDDSINKGADAYGTDAEGDSEEEEDGSEEDDDDEEDEEEEEILYPALSCIVFNDFGCNSECSVIASAYGQTATGTCDEENICDCTITDDASLESLWDNRFKSSSSKVLQQIKKNDELTEKVRKILELPFTTGHEIKEELKSVLTNDQIAKLDVKSDSPAANMTKKDGKPDLAAVREHVRDQLPEIVKSSGKKLTASACKNALLKGLKKAREADEEDDSDDFQHLYWDVRRTKNASLSDIVDEYIKKNKIKKPSELDDEHTVADTIASVVMDELVKGIAKPKSKSTKASPAKTPSARGKFSPGKSSTIEDRKPAKQATKISPKKDSTESAVSGRFTLPGFDKSPLKRKGELSHSWNTRQYNVSYSRSWGGDISLSWNKGSDNVSISKCSSGDVSQSWNLGNVNISISRSGNDVSENWNAPGVYYSSSRSSDGSISSSGDAKSIGKYKKLIDSWCAANSFLIEKKYCVIY